MEAGSALPRRLLFIQVRLDLFGRLKQAALRTAAKDIQGRAALHSVLTPNRYLDGLARYQLRAIELHPPERTFTLC